jgi:predicted RNase H-like HicB family nuclease
MSTRISTVSFESTVIEHFNNWTERLAAFISDGNTMIVKFPDGSFQMSYRDPDNNFSVGVTGSTLEEAFDKIEAAVEILSR